MLGAEKLSLDQHKEAGMKALKAAEFSVALDHYHAACELAPKQYMNFIQRATVYRAMGRGKQAAKDYTTVLALKPDFVQVMQRMCVCVVYLLGGWIC